MCDRLKSLIMEKIIGLIYQYYLSRNKFLPYTKSILTIVGIIMLHLFLIFTIFNLFDYLPSWTFGSVHLSSNTNITSFTIFLTLCLFLIYNKERLAKFVFCKKKIERTWRYLMIYCLGIFIVLILFPFLR